MTIERFITYINHQIGQEQDSERREAYQAVHTYLDEQSASKAETRKTLIAWLERALRQSRRVQGDAASPYLSSAQVYAHLRDVLNGRIEVQVPKDVPGGQLSLWQEV